MFGGLKCVQGIMKRTGRIVKCNRRNILRFQMHPDILECIQRNVFSSEMRQEHYEMLSENCEMQPEKYFEVSKAFGLYYYLDYYLSYYLYYYWYHYWYQLPVLVLLPVLLPARLLYLCYRFRLPALR